MLEEELPALIAALGARLGRVESVSYHLGDWDSPPCYVGVKGGTARVAGYRMQHAGTVDVIARDHRVTLLVVGAKQTEQEAHTALHASAEQGNTDDVATLLAHLAAPADGQKGE